MKEMIKTHSIKFSFIGFLLILGIILSLSLTLTGVFTPFGIGLAGLTGAGFVLFSITLSPMVVIAPLMYLYEKNYERFHFKVKNRDKKWEPLDKEQDVERESLTPQVKRKQTTQDTNPLGQGVKELGQNLRDSIKGFKKTATGLIAKISRSPQPSPKTTPVQSRKVTTQSNSQKANPPRDSLKGDSAVTTNFNGSSISNDTVLNQPTIPPITISPSENKTLLSETYSNVIPETNPQPLFKNAYEDSRKNLKTSSQDLFESDSDNESTDESSCASSREGSPWFSRKTPITTPIQDRKFLNFKVSSPGEVISDLSEAKAKAEQVKKILIEEYGTLYPKIKAFQVKKGLKKIFVLELTKEDIDRKDYEYYFVDLKTEINEKYGEDTMHYYSYSKPDLKETSKSRQNTQFIPKLQINDNKIERILNFKSTELNCTAVSLNM